MRKLNSQFITRFISEPGLSGLNGVYYGFVEMDQYFCLAVSEGYDGEGGMESAKLAVDSAIDAFIGNPGMSAAKIRACLKRADKKLSETSVRLRLKAGILLIVSDYTRFRYGTCGNVMLYALRNSGIYHQSPTHTVYQPMEAETGGETKNLYYYLGGSCNVTVSAKQKLEDGDLLLIATEGFWSRVNNVEILDAYESIQSEEEFLGDLQELYLRGSTDSAPCFSLAAVGIKKAYKENTGRKRKIRRWSLVLLLILAIGGTVFYFTAKSRKRKQEETRNTIEVYKDTGDQYLLQLGCILAKQEYEKAGEAGKRLSRNDEKLKYEQMLSEKIRLSSLLDNAEKAYSARNYAQARTEYKMALEIVRSYSELIPLINEIERKLKLVSAGMEIQNYIQNASLKEAEGALAEAAILYDKAEAMLRILDDPEQLQQVQLAQLRVKGQAAQADKEERARARDTVIAEANETAAINAVLTGDLELAVELYTKIRDSYIALEENEKAEQMTAVILSLQNQLITGKKEQLKDLEEEKQKAFDVVLSGDIRAALEQYEKIRDAYLVLEETEKAEEVTVLMTALAGQEGNPTQTKELIIEEPENPKGPGSQTEAREGNADNGYGPGTETTVMEGGGNG